MIASFHGWSQHNYLFIGTYTSGESKGIYVYDFDSRTGTLKPIGYADSVENPSFLTVSKNGKYLYAVNETGGEKPGSASSFSFNKKTGKLKFLNTQPTSGDHPCYIDVDREGDFVVAGNYSGGSLALFPVKDGMLQPAIQVIQHTGNGANKLRQEKAHVHATKFSPDNKYVLVPDLGIDKVMIYPFDRKAGQPLNKDAAKAVTITPGSGPRHISFHPNGKYVYLVEELSGMVTGFEFNDGTMKRIQTINAHPDSYTEAKGSADIHVSADGKFLYASNRAASNTIGIFSIDESSGHLSTVGFQPTLGNTPRNFSMDPSGNFLLVANQQSNNIIVFKRDKETGLLKETGISVEVPSPVCLKFLKK